MPLSQNLHTVRIERDERRVIDLIDRVDQLVADIRNYSGQFQADNTDSYQNLDTGQTHCLPSLDEYMGTLALNATRLIGPLCTLVDRINEKRSRK